MHKRTLSQSCPVKNGEAYAIDWEAVKEGIMSAPKDIAPPVTPFVVIDEGQDMPPAFYHALAEMGLENLYVVADQNQQITEDNSNLRDIENALAIDTKDRVEADGELPKLRSCRPAGLGILCRGPGEPTGQSTDRQAMRPHAGAGGLRPGLPLGLQRSGSAIVEAGGSRPGKADRGLHAEQQLRQSGRDCPIEAILPQDESILRRWR